MRLSKKSLSLIGGINHIPSLQLLQHTTPLSTLTDDRNEEPHLFFLMSTWDCGFEAIPITIKKKHTFWLRQDKDVTSGILLEGWGEEKRLYHNVYVNLTSSLS